MEEYNNIKSSVKFNNEFNKIPLRNFNAVELNFLMYLCSKLKEKRDTIMEISFKDVKEMTKYKRNNKNRFIKDLQSMNRKLLDCKFSVETSHELIDFVLFTTFKINPEEGILTVRVNEDFIFMLNELEKFTKFELSEFVDIKSSYVKECYRRLKQFKDTGWWLVTIEDFRYLLDIPDSYRMCDIDRRVLVPIYDELSTCFNNFEIEKIKEGNKITKLKFKFDKQIKSVMQDEDNINTILNFEDGIEKENLKSNFFERNKKDIEKNKKKILNKLETETEEDFFKRLRKERIK